MDILSKRQRGFSLLESMIGIVLVGISGLGVAYSLAASMRQQVEDNVQNLVLNELRGELASKGVQVDCSIVGTTTTSEIMILNRDMKSTQNVEYSKTCSYQKSIVTINNIEKKVMLPTFTITASDPRLGRYALRIQN
ncbi:PulJ/GspJ family protein [Shewanella psychrotolerans]|uniref:PulJ/GspJ family protein n=1 Tax=Shewanella psychrotolerans TaxID=2864206 RepID=UPI001C65BF6B|nr:type II secretion system protein [Shewanella psychrotolerans]QYK00082.1 type II secretion system GspH family protein [Shewanella psychrotolerans]